MLYQGTKETSETQLCTIHFHCSCPPLQPTNCSCCLKMKVAQLCLTLCESMGFSRPEYWSEQPFPSPGDLPNPGIKPRSPSLKVNSSPAEPQGVGSLSLLQWAFPIQELNQGLLHRRWILYQLSIREAPYKWVKRQFRILNLFKICTKKVEYITGL